MSGNSFLHEQLIAMERQFNELLNRLSEKLKK